MPAKRQSILAKLESERPEPPRATIAAPDAERSGRAASPSARPGIKKNTLYLSDAVHDRLREIAFTERRRVHDLFLEGIDRVLENRGHSERTSDGKPL